MLTIENSPISWCFHGYLPSALARMDYLEPHQSADVWKQHIGAGRSFFDASADSWVNRSEWRTIGTWMDAYNDPSHRDGLPRLIESRSAWGADESLLLVQDRERIVRLEFRDFSDFWLCLFAAFDDAPLLISIRHQANIAFRFASFGGVLECEILAKNWRPSELAKGCAQFPKALGQ